MPVNKKNKIWMMIYVLALAILSAGMFILIFPEVPKAAFIVPIAGIYAYAFYSNFFKKKNLDKGVPGEPK